MGKKTRVGFVAIAIFFVVIAGVKGQISPGDLAEPHAHLEGISNCTKCHLLGKNVSGEKCLECHKLLKSRVDAGKGYHTSSEVKGKECIECHSDHHGRKFELIRFDTEQFDHDLTGYTLEGKHAETQCKDCHKKENIQLADARDKKYTYLGLDQVCLSCHEDYHQESLGKDCISCHGFEKFKPAEKFDHADSKFKLVGKHQDVACDKCHKTVISNGKEMQQFTGLQFASCVNCHEDVHNNRFGQNCAECHTEESFKKIRGIETFDHSATGFLLEGKHVNVQCKKCHTGSYTEPVKHDLCADCHKDYHQKQFETNGQSPDCKTCHTVNGFSPSTYTLEKHNESAFPLKGAHIATPCFVCHLQESSNRWEFENIGLRCVDCHEDIHEPYLDKKYYPEATCKSCHSESRWSEIDFDHNKTEYKLEGKHATQTCRSCHFAETNGEVHQRFSKLTTTCTQCHNDIHYKQFEARGETGCVSCHDYENWKASKFDHNKTQFSLGGAHQNVACKECHKPVQTAENTTYILYKIPSFKCADCHK